MAALPSDAAPTGLSAMLSVGVANVFEQLGVGATIWDGTRWRPLHAREDLIWFEAEHGVGHRRSRYNAGCMHRAWHGREFVLGEHAGLSDVFAPIFSGDRVVAVLLIGPFFRARPSTPEIVDRWRWLTGRQAHPEDPEFARYLSDTLATLVLEGKRVDAFADLVRVFTRLIAGFGSTAALRDEADRLAEALSEARYVDRVWAAAASMVDERTTRSWATPFRDLGSVGLERVPDHLLVGLFVNRGGDGDPVEESVRRDAFQRASVAAMRKAGHALAGRVGDRGITVLSAALGSRGRKRQRLLDLADKTASLARRFGFEIHLGLGAASATLPLGRVYHAALAAAEAALGQGVRMVEAGARPTEGRTALRDLRASLGRAGPQDAVTLAARFERYLDAVASQTGYRLEPARAHLDAGFERATEALIAFDAIDERSHRELCAVLERSADAAQTLSELFGAYRRAIADAVEAVRRPVAARRDRNLRRAIDYIERHYVEELSRPEVAKIAGFAESHFGELFKRREDMSFERYVCRRRIERAQELLATTDLDVQQVAQLAGFKERHYFARAFRREVGVTPTEHRRAARLQ